MGGGRQRRPGGAHEETPGRSKFLTPLGGRTTQGVGLGALSMTRFGAIFSKRDWVPGLLGIVAVLALNVATDTIQGLELQWYDHGVSASSRTPSSDVAVVAIDDASIAKLGPWPWSRELHAQVIDKLTAGGARSIVLAVPVSQPQAEPGLAQLKRLSEVVGADVDLAIHPVLPLLLEQAMQALDADTHLQRAIQTSRRTVLPVVLSPTLAGAAAGAFRNKMPPGLARSLPPSPAAGTLIAAPAAQWPLPALADAAAGVGHTAWLPDADGVLRTHPLLLNHEGRAVPSLALLTAARQRGVASQTLPRLLAPQGQPPVVQWGGLQVPTEGQALARTHFYASADERSSPFSHDSFHAVYSGEIPANRYARKTVLIGLTATGLAPTIATSVAPAMSAVDVLAHQTSSLLSGHFISRPGWAIAALVAALLAVAAYLVAVVPRLAARSALAVSTVLAIALLAAGHLLLTQASLWVPCVLPVAALAVGQGAMTMARLVLTAVGPQDADDPTGVQAMRLLGLSLQRQGQPELAWEQLRNVPLALLDTEQAMALMDKLYELGQDFEDNGRLGHAQSVYAHLVRHDQAYRDVAQRLLHMRSMAHDTEPGVPSTLPALWPAPATGPVPAQAAVAPPPTPVPVPVPMATPATGNGTVTEWPLGRFMVQRELGRGAMGAVYLGVDPQSRRQVAIKTMALAHEFSGDQLADARQRFLREAETAGRLRHPDIVTIIDAGEDRNLAYIAMELLSGYDLTRHTRPGSLLPVPQVLQIAARVADALAFAHKHGVIHRDVKPANVMINPAIDQVKVTDFGIARVTDASKTRTGAVLGTPSYMSPEQLAGRRLDGRSDLYSLGVMLFQLLTGQLPMRGDSMAALMYAIANTPAPDVRSVRPELPQTLAEVVALALEKRPEVRYADGEQLALDLRTVVAMVEAAEAAAAGGPGPGDVAVPQATAVAPSPPAAEAPAAVRQPPPVPQARPAPLPVPATAVPHQSAPVANAVRGVWRSSVRKARREAQAELFADTQPSMPMPLEDDGFGHNRPG
jgi:eukaryotic-like serine/threonine-protein kinase